MKLWLSEFKPPKSPVYTSRQALIFLLVQGVALAVAIFMLGYVLITTIWLLVPVYAALIYFLLVQALDAQRDYVWLKGQGR